MRQATRAILPRSAERRSRLRPELLIPSTMKRRRDERLKWVIADAMLAEMGPPPESAAERRRLIKAALPDKRRLWSEMAHLWKIAAVFPPEMRKPRPASRCTSPLVILWCCGFRRCRERWWLDAAPLLNRGIPSHLRQK